ncbi:MAG: glycerate kinase, partial [Agromyces sp.]
VVELADVSGLVRLPGGRPAPMTATSRGTGEVMAAAIDSGCTRIILGIGGSASTDGGAGALSVLGARILAADQATVQLGNRGLGALAGVDLTGLRPLPRGGALILGDVTNPLLGERGAAAVFGPQKGADAATVAVLDANLARLARLLPDVASDTPGAGAAGGTGFALLAWGAAMGGGAELVADALGLERDIARADLVITGEGRFDGQSEAGKAPSEVARLAASCGAPVALVAGAITAEPRGFAASVDLTVLAGGSEPAMADPLRWLEAAGAQLAAETAAETEGVGPS